MHRQQIRRLVYLFIAFALSGCGGKEKFNVEQEIERFYTHQDVFEKLATTGCEAREAMDTRFFRYPMDVTGDESESIQHYFADIENLLNSMGLKQIVLRTIIAKDIDCSLYLSISDFSFLADGYSFGYWYQPADHGTYEYSEGFFSQETTEYRDANRVRGEEEVKFSIALESGWYLQYYRYP